MARVSHSPTYLAGAPWWRCVGIALSLLPLLHWTHTHERRLVNRKMDRASERTNERANEWYATDMVWQYIEQTMYYIIVAFNTVLVNVFLFWATRQTSDCCLFWRKQIYSNTIQMPYLHTWSISVVVTNSNAFRIIDRRSSIIWNA